MLRILSLVFLLSVRAVLAAENEADLMTQASKAFADKFYDRADAQLAEFVKQFPGSTNVPNAILLQAEARFFQRRYDAASDLLQANVARAGPLAAEFTFWTAEAQSQLQNYEAAAAFYHRVLIDFPQSPIALRASYLEAFSVFQLKDYPRAIELLQKPDGFFQKLAKSAPNDPSSIRGRLLLADSLITSGKFEQARTALQQLTPPADQLEFAWEKNYLLARAELATQSPGSALPFLTNALVAANGAKKPLLEAQTRSLEADVYRKLGFSNEAVAAYEKIGAIEALPAEQTRLALLKAVELLSTSRQITSALARIESYLNTHTNESAADLLKIKAGELWIDQFRQDVAAKNPPAAVATNALSQARAYLSSVLTQFTNSIYLGRAWLDLGWCAWEEGTAFDRPARIQESESAFQTAAEKLTRSDDQALAYFKMADAELSLKNASAARTNYLAVIRNYTDLPQVRNALLNHAYMQLIRANLELKDFVAARAILSEFRKEFPNDPLAEQALFQFGQTLAIDGQTAEARTSFEEFIRSYPGSALAPEVRFANARTYAAEGDFQTALKKHAEWLQSYTNHALRATVEFRRDILVAHAGQSSNALALFTSFLTQFPTNSLAPAAQTWVADYYYDQEQWPLAEQNYQRVFQNTNWQSSPLRYEAKLMAAKTAFKRQGYGDARAYLTNLINTLNIDTNAPAEVSAEAYFVLGDVFLEEPITGSTNAVQNFIEAARVFDRIATQYPSNKLAVLAMGKKGDCYLQLAALPNYADSYKDATNSYSAVLNSKLPDLPISARNQAEVGLGLALKGLAETKPPPEKELLQKSALDHFLNVVYGDERNEQPDPYYLKLAGLEAGRLAESMGNTSAALQLYRRLSIEAPSLKAFWETRIASLQQRLAAE